MNRKFALCQHITKEFHNEWLNKLKAQYIAHKIFKKDGLIKSYLNHSVLRRLNQKEMKYLGFQAEHPWRFSFSVILDNPAENYYII